MAQIQQNGAGQVGRDLLLPLIHGRVRLLVLSSLLRTRKGISFTSLRDELKLTDGTLSVHLSKLEEGALVAQEKSFEGKKPLTTIKVTPKGRRLFRKYVDDLKSIIPGLS